jgi:predicted Zn-dependent peptidase
MRVAMAILQQQVFQEVRVQRNLSYAPGADMNSFAANTANISVSAVNANEAVRVMLSVIGAMKNNTVPQETIEEMGNFFLTTYYLKQETNAAQAGELASYELNGGGWRNSLVFLDKMRQVTPAEVRAVANKYMKNIRFVVVGNPASIDKVVFLPAD